MTPDMEFRISGRNKTAAAFAEVRADMHRTGDALSPLGQKIDMVTSKLGMLPTLLKATLVGVGVEAARSFAGAVGDANNAVADLYDMARTSNVSFEGFQALGYAAKQNRIEIDSLGQGLREMQDKAEEFATTGGGRAAEAFQRMGYNATSLREALRDPINLFEDIIEKMGDLDRAAQIRLMGDIFGGGEGDQFLKLLDDGKAGLEALQQTARDTGKIMGEDLGAAAVETRRKFDEFAASFDLWWKGVAVRVGEYATGVGGRMGVSGAPLKPGNAIINGVADPGLPMPIGSAVINGVIDPGLPAPPPYTAPPVVDPREALYGGMTGRGAKYTPAERLWDLPAKSGGGSIKSTTKDVVEFTDELTKATGQVDDLSLKLSTSLTDGVMSVWQAFRSGENVLQSVSNQLLSVADQLLGQSIQQFFSQIFGSALGVGGIGGLKSLPGPGGLTGSVKMFDSGGWTGGTAGQPAGVVHGEEFVVKAGPAAANRGALEAMNAGRPLSGGSGGALTVTALVEVVNGNLVPTMVKVSGEVAGQKIKTDAVPAMLAYQRNGGR